MSTQQPILFRVVLDDSGVPVPAKRTEDSLNRMGKAAEGAGAGLLKFGADGKASAAQLQALSYQATDIVTQLAGGQSPLLILLQQGGQLRDQFGGVGNVFRAVGSIVTPTALAIGALATGVGVLAVAAASGYLEVDRLTKSLALNGNAAGVTITQINDLARALAQTSDVSVGAARDALGGLAGTGAFVGSTLQTAGRAVLAVQKLSGQSTDDIVKNFASMRNGVAAWATEANRAYNVFTAAQVRAVQALEAQGRTQEAARLALDVFAGTMESRAVPALGYLERSINAVKQAGADFWDWLKDAGRPDTPEEILRKAQQGLEALEQRLRDAKSSDVKQAGLSLMERERDEARQRVALAAETVRMQQRGAERQAAEAAKNNREILESSAGYQGALIGREQSFQARLLADQQRGIQARRLAADEGYRTFVLSAQQYNAEVEELEREKIASEEQAARASIAAAARRVAANPQEELARRQAVLQAETQLVNVLARRDALEARIRNGELQAKPREVIEDARAAFRQQELANDGYAQTNRLMADQREEARKLALATRDYAYALAEAEGQRRRGMDRDLDGARLGGRARERADRMAAIASQYNAGRARLDDELRANRITRQAYDERLQLLREYHERALADEQVYQDARAALEADASVGFDRALADYLDSSRNVAEQAEGLWGNAFRGMEDALVQFATTGKASFGDLARSIIADLIRIQIRAQLAGMLGSGGGLGGLLGGIGSLFGLGGGGGLGGVNASAGTAIIPPTFAAKGLATDGLHAFASGGVVDRPTLFRFAAGGALRNGVMGEAGPEAILPLRRGADGALGVMAGGAAAPAVQINLQVVNASGNNVKATASDRGGGTIEVLLEAVDQDMAERVSSGRGATSLALQQRFGLRPAMA